MIIDITQDPAFQQLVAELRELREEVRDLRKLVPSYVPVEQAMELTGLSATSLWRERKKPGTVLVTVQDHGLRYERASLLAYNKLRTQVRSRGRGQS
jgi:hypothetical protein